jgi:type III restriction enzyme
VASTVAQAQGSVMVPDVYAYIQNQVHLSRSTIFSILNGADRFGELALNPQAFLEMVVHAIKNDLQHLLVAGIEYREINGQRYEMTLWDEDIETYLSSVYPSPEDPSIAPLKKTLLEAQPINEQSQSLSAAFSCIVSQSAPEEKFAHDCSLDDNVKFFFKLPQSFKISTPLGPYNPDWAVVFENDRRVYFVAETKSSLLQFKRRPEENMKIQCGRKHFELAPDVVFKEATHLKQLTDVAEETA